MKLRKSYYITACALLVGGIVLTGVSIAAGAWNPTKYAEAVNLKDRYFEVTEPFTSIDCQTDVMDVTIQAAEGDICTISATNLPDDQIHVTVEDGTLCIDARPEKEKWYTHFQFGIAPPASEVTISLPIAVYETVTLNSDTADIQVKDLKADIISVENNTGTHSLQNITCKNLSVSNDVGDTSLEQVQVREKLHIQQNTGDLEMQNCIANGSGTITNDVGNLRITDSKLVRTEIDSGIGDVDLKDCTLYDNCKIENDVGDVTCVLYAEKDSCSVDAETDVGEIRVNGEKSGYRIPNAMNTLTIRTDTGDIRVDFKEIET